MKIKILIVEKDDFFFKGRGRVPHYTQREHVPVQERKTSACYNIHAQPLRPPQVW